jgi:hypothetical protein
MTQDRLADTPGGIRTCDLLVRNELLYPAELRGRVAAKTSLQGNGGFSKGASGESHFRLAKAARTLLATCSASLAEPSDV